MSNTKTATKQGLEGINAADSSVSAIDGRIGELSYRGYRIKDLADHSTFAETVYLLLEGELPSAAQLTTFEQELAAQRPLPPEILALLRDFAPQMTPMDCMRTLVSAMALVDRPQNDDGMDIHRRRVVSLTAKLPTILATYHRLRNGQEPIAPSPELGTAADFLTMLNGERPSEAAERMLDTCLVLHAEHGFNASTFAARVTAATLSDVYSAITSAIGTLKGPLHGGANTAVMEMLLEIGEVSRAERYLDEKLHHKQKVMGFGHRVYKVIDPRALVLRGFSQRMAKDAGDPRWYEISRRLEQLMHDRKGIEVNVDFFSASTYYAMGIEPDLFTGIFAISRMAGWGAHVLEQYANNRLIRPRANYTGHGPRAYQPIDQRD